MALAQVSLGHKGLFGAALGSNGGAPRSGSAPQTVPFVSNCQAKGRCISHGGGNLCQEPGCGKVAKSPSTRCVSHGGGKRCAVEGCSNTAESRGKCRSHGGGKRCEAEGCDRASQSHGKCKKHGGGKRCEEPSCDKSGKQRGCELFD